MKAANNKDSHNALFIYATELNMLINKITPYFTDNKRAALEILSFAMDLYLQKKDYFSNRLEYDLFTYRIVEMKTRLSFLQNKNIKINELTSIVMKINNTLDILIDNICKSTASKKREL